MTKLAGEGLKRGERATDFDIEDVDELSDNSIDDFIMRSHRKNR